jgi:glutamine amidotransferase
MCNWSEENDTQCLGIFDIDVRKFRPRQQEKVPHMGWNRIYQLDLKMFAHQLEGEYTYFVHSYYVPVTSFTTALCDYIQPFSAAISRDNFYATQFHPEKSGPVGSRIIQKFLEI